MNLLDLWVLLLVVVLIAGIVGRKRFSRRTKLWLWRAGFALFFLVGLANQQDIECRTANVNPEVCLRAPITVVDLVKWLAMAGLLYLFYRSVTRKLRKAMALERETGAAKATDAR